MSSAYTGIEDRKTGEMRHLEEHEHQVIVITIKGPTTQAVTDEWNEFIKQIKPKFDGNLIGITIEGAKTPVRFFGTK